MDREEFLARRKRIARELARARNQLATTHTDIARLEGLLGKLDGFEAGLPTKGKPGAPARWAGAEGLDLYMLVNGLCGQVAREGRSLSTAEAVRTLRKDWPGWKGEKNLLKCYYDARKYWEPRIRQWKVDEAEREKALSIIERRPRVKSREELARIVNPLRKPEE
jgi:hypothetical protein